MGTHQQIAIAASFTTEPLEDTLRFWMETLRLDAEIAFAPYNQIYQELLDPESLLRKNRTGINVVLLRFEDWGRVQSHEGEENVSLTTTAAETERNARDFIDTLKACAARTSALHLVCICPASPNLDSQRRQLFAALEEQVVAELQGAPGVYPVSSAEITRLYPEATEYDTNGDRRGHIPYTPKAFAALATVLARKIHALRRSPYKVIALDCDNTLWSGVVGEDGALGVKVNPPHGSLQRFLLGRRDAGMLLCLCSKNVEEDVFEVLDKHPDMVLRRDDIVSSKVNWQPKSQNLCALATGLKLGLDSFIFIDDSPIECSEVAAGCPEVLTLLLPEPGRIPHFMEHMWAFDTMKISEEDRQRSGLYRQNAQRDSFQGKALSFREFLNGLELVIDIAPMAPEHLPRVSQLTYRTNQFNTTTIRRTEAEILSVCAAPAEAGGYGCLVIQVKDRFGDYGLVGTALFTSRGEALYVDSLMMSCRVLGRGVEHRLIARLGEIAAERGASRVDIAFLPTTKNRPARDFLRLGDDFKQEADGGLLFRLPAGFARAMEFVPGSESAAEAKAASASEVAPVSAAAPSDAALLRRIAEELSDASSVLRAVEAHRLRDRPEAAGAYLAPSSELETGLAAIWSKLLGVEPVGVHDNFFQLGGSSLLAVRLFTEIGEQFEQALPITTLLTAPTIERLAAVVERRDSAPVVSPLVPIQPLGSRPPFFCVHGARGKVLGFRNAALLLGLEQPFYGLQAADLEDHEVDDVTVEGLAAKYLAAIQEEYPQGPYSLGGNCFGSLVALEMARTLRSENQQVAFLALFDPPLLSLKSFARYPHITLLGLASNAVRRARRPLRDNLALLGTVVLNMRLHFKERFAKAPAAGQTPEKNTINSETAIPRRLQNIFFANMQAARLYRAKPYSGPVSLFLARENSSLRNSICEAEWRSVTKGGVEVKIVPAHHGRFFDDPGVQPFSALLAKCMDRVWR